ncbi:MAG: hypothetical protein EA398_04840 [Deltaproteobacteria bacterium]|nr:MAG: hypothetical protein EA398_04840 [Deltaproteobacteria bacterium]
MPSRSLPFARRVACATLALSLGTALPALADEDVDPLFEEPAPVDRAETIRDLITLGLASEDAAVRAWALRAAAAHGDRAWRDTIAGELDNAQFTVRLNAALALLDLNHRARDAQARITEDLATGDAQTRAYVLDRVFPLLPEATRARVLRDGVARMDEELALRQTLAQLARRATGAEHAVLEAGADIDDAERRAWYVDPVRRAAREEGLGLAGRLVAQRDAERQREGLAILQAIATADARAAAAPLLRSSHAAVAQEAGLYLARFGDTGALQNVRDLALNADMDVELRIEALRIVRDTAPQMFSMEQLQEAIPGSGVELRAALHEAIGATRSPEAVAWLEALLDADFAEERMDAISGIGFSGVERHVETVGQILASQGAVNIRVRAARALGHLGGDAAAQRLVTALRMERDSDVKAQIVLAMGDTGSADAAQPILYEFARNDDTVTAAGLDALRALGNTEIAPQLVSVANNYRNASLRWRAALVLTHLDPALGAERLIAMLDRPPAGFESDLAGLPADLRRQVDARLLRHANPEIAEAALARVRSHADGGLEFLRPLALDAASAEVRRVAINAVTNARQPQDAELLTELTRHRDRQVRLQAWAALAEMRDTDQEQLFADQLGTTDVAVRVIAAYGLIRMGRAS